MRIITAIASEEAKEGDEWNVMLQDYLTRLECLFIEKFESNVNMKYNGD